MRVHDVVVAHVPREPAEHRIRGRPFECLSREVPNLLAVELYEAVERHVETRSIIRVVSGGHVDVDAALAQRLHRVAHSRAGSTPGGTDRGDDVQHA